MTQPKTKRGRGRPRKGMERLVIYVPPRVAAFLRAAQAEEESLGDTVTRLLPTVPA